MEYFFLFGTFFKTHKITGSTCFKFIRIKSVKIKLLLIAQETLIQLIQLILIDEIFLKFIYWLCKCSNTIKNLGIILWKGKFALIHNLENKRLKNLVKKIEKKCLFLFYFFLSLVNKGKYKFYIRKA